MSSPYGINTEEFLDGHLHVTMNEDTDRYGFEDFLREFEGDVCAETVADAWNQLADKHGWTDKLHVVDEDADEIINLDEL